MGRDPCFSPTRKKVSSARGKKRNTKMLEGGSLYDTKGSVARSIKSKYDLSCHMVHGDSCKDS